ncbi:MAG TPA: hypothetical protein P5317_12635 [Myxococcota bacterium]|nr:hypothetical protein [Myxococcota bacterium]
MSNVYVFGSNLAGRHGKGSALHAKLYFGAIPGQGIGRQGNSYAIPTKDFLLKPLPLNLIQQHIIDFCAYANCHFEESFHVVEIGCGLAGYTPEQIAPMFKCAPENVNLPQSFIKILNNE